MISSVRIYCKLTYFNRRVERHFSSKMKRKSRDSDLTLELSCHAGFPTDSYYIVDTTCRKEAFFYARLSSTTTLNTYSIIKFDTIITNNGNHYHPADDVFVAPISGVYMFAWSTLRFNNKGLYTELRVENEVKCIVESNAGSSLYTPGSTSLLCHVNKGEHVWVQTSGWTSDNYIYDWIDSTSFMGFLFQKD